MCLRNSFLLIPKWFYDSFYEDWKVVISVVIFNRFNSIKVPCETTWNPHLEEKQNSFYGPVKQPSSNAPLLLTSTRSALLTCTAAIIMVFYRSGCARLYGSYDNVRQFLAHCWDSLYTDFILRWYVAHFQVVILLFISIQFLVIFI